MNDIREAVGIFWPLKFIESML